MLTTVLGDHRIPDTTVLGLRVAPKLIATIVPLKKAASASRYSLVQAPALPSEQDGSFTSLSEAGGLLAAQWAVITTMVAGAAVADLDGSETVP